MKKLAVMIGAVFAGIAASACCILPAVLGVASAGSVGLGAAVAPYRPYLMILTILMLGAGFYFTYRPQEAACDADGGCVTPKAASTRRFGKVMLWGVTMFTLAAMAYPWIAAERARTQAETTPVVAVSATAQTAVFHVSKMSCAECSLQIADAVKKTPGVYDAQVDFAAQRATVRYDGRRISAAQVRAAIDRTGFPAKEVKAP